MNIEKNEEVVVDILGEKGVLKGEVWNADETTDSVTVKVQEVIEEPNFGTDEGETVNVSFHEIEKV